MALSEAARQAKNEYARQWRKRNRERTNEYQKKWRGENPDKCKLLLERYWEKRASVSNSE